ncbi:MAG: hypothetical protein JWN45_156 [Acidobacteriaceae bacterium]|nr:hypothetical protein [Acidobacteriaceae bacterium]
MRIKPALQIVILFFAATLSAFGQKATAYGSVSAPLPKVHFAFDHDAMEVPHYEFDVDADGHAVYKSSGKPAAQSGEVETLNKNFNLSPATRTRIFELAKQADYFNGSFDYTKNKVAFTGKKTLSYSDKTRSGSASFNWSENKPITELASLFQGISATLEAEPRLRRLRRFDKLGLNAELASLEQLANSGFLAEIGLIGDCLRDIANDGAVMGMARKRAEHLLQMASDGQR